ncbi:MAG: hypothetical protein GX027_04755 [Clostridiaceae bacterium]|nr:hypothetical protein [Clostridiaceae bacterium]
MPCKKSMAHILKEFYRTYMAVLNPHEHDPVYHAPPPNGEIPVNQPILVPPDIGPAIEFFQGFNPVTGF